MLIRKDENAAVVGKSSKEIWRITAINLAAIGILAGTFLISPGLSVIGGIIMAIMMEQWRKKKTGIFYRESAPKLLEMPEKIDLYEAGHRRPIHSIAFTAVGKNLLSVDSGQRVCIWNSATGEKWKDYSSDADKSIVKFAGSKYVFGISGQSLRVWAHEGKRVALMPTWTSDSVVAHHASRDGNAIALSFSKGETGVWLVDSQTGFLLPPDSEGPAFDLCLMPGNQTLVTVHGGKLLYIWDLHKKHVRRMIAGHEADIIAVTAGGNDSQVISLDAAGKVRICDAGTGELVNEFMCGFSSFSRIARIAYDESSNTIAISGSGSQISTWDAHTGIAGQVYSGEISAVRCMQFSPGGSFLAASGFPHHIAIWNVRDTNSAKEDGK